MENEIDVDLPEKFQFLFEPSRFKIAHGGRGGGKSWAFAKALIIKAMQEELLIICAREVQRSIKESVHRLIKKQINLMGVSESFSITDTSIKCPTTGSEFIFLGLLRNIDAVKSLEGANLVWIEEAHNVSEESWEVLTPTIRETNSEIWVSFNPKYEDDHTYQKYVVDPPDNSKVVKVNYYDNPWFAEPLITEMKQDKARDKTLYEHKWLGLAKGGGGKVFPNFDKKLHVKQFDKKLIAEKANCFMAMDPHSHYYPFITWLAIIPKNDRANWPEDFHKHIYAEWPTFDDLGGYYHDLRKKLFFKGSLEDLAREIYAKDGTEYGIKVLRRFIDSRYAKGSGSWNWSTSTEGIVELFSKPENGGLKFECPYEKNIDAQRQVLHKDMLYNTLQKISDFNEPTFSVDPSCRNTIISLQNHRLEEDPKGDGSLEKENDKYKEASDTIRINYAGLVDFRYKNPIQSTTKQKFYSRAAGAFG